MKTIALNIETAADPAAMENLPDPEVKLGNVKDPEKIKARMEDAKAKMRSLLALDPFFARILCLTAALRRNGELKVITVFADDAGGEDKLLAWIWKQLSANGDNQAPRLVTFNGAAFDVPFLYARSLINRVKAPPFIDCGKYRVTDPAGQHVDLYQTLVALCGPVDVPRNLAFFVKQLLGEDWPYKDLDQSALGDLVANGGKDKVQALCEWNTTRTLLLYELVQQHVA